MIYNSDTLLSAAAPNYMQQMTLGADAVNRLNAEANNPYGVMQAEQAAGLDYQKNFDNLMGQFYREVQRRGGSTMGLNDASLQNLAMERVLGLSQAMTGAGLAEQEKQLGLTQYLAGMGADAASQAAQIGSGMYSSEMGLAGDQIRSDASLESARISADASMANARTQADTSMYNTDKQFQTDMYQIDTDAETKKYISDLDYIESQENIEAQKDMNLARPITLNQGMTGVYYPGTGDFVENPYYTDSASGSSGSDSDAWLMYAIDKFLDYGPDIIKLF